MRKRNNAYGICQTFPPSGNHCRGAFSCIGFRISLISLKFHVLPCQRNAMECVAISELSELRASFAPCRSACRWHRTGRPRRHLRWHLGIPEFLQGHFLGPIDCLQTARVYDLFYLSFHVRRNWDAKPRWDPRRVCATLLGTDPRPERNESRLSAGRHDVPPTHALATLALAETCSAIDHNRR